MTENRSHQSSTHGHRHGHAHGHTHDQQHDDQVSMLEDDAVLLGDYLEEATAWIATYAGEPARVLDLGAGTGVGTLALARRFPSAVVTAADVDPRMLALLSRAADDAGLGERVRTVELDLDGAWPTGPAGTGGLDGHDVVWASGSLHHVADPDRLLRDLAAGLAPGGVLAVVEMAGAPRFLGEDDELERRVSTLLDERFHSFPDWAPNLAAAGLEVRDRRTFTQEAGPGRPEVARAATTWLGRLRTGLADELPAADLARLDRLLDPTDPDALARRTDLVARGRRTAWLARPTPTLP